VSADFASPFAQMEMQFLGLLGKLLSGPWMKMFYTSAESQINFVEGIRVVKLVVARLKDKLERPITVLAMKKDFFGNDLNASDVLLQSLQSGPSHNELFMNMAKVCLQAAVDVLERQYQKYFVADLTEKLMTESARSHNILAEELVGMFGALKNKAPSATICYLSAKMRAQKNKTVRYLDCLDEKRRDEILEKVVPLAAKQRRMRKVSQKSLIKELVKRQSEKQQVKDNKARKKLETKLKSCNIKNISQSFPDLSEQKLEKLTDILSGKCIGSKICHMWTVDNETVLYNGKIIDVKGRGKARKYVVSYWSQDEQFDHAVDFELSGVELAADFINDELTM